MTDCRQWMPQILKNFSQWNCYWIGMQNDFISQMENKKKIAKQKIGKYVNMTWCSALFLCLSIFGSQCDMILLFVPISLCCCWYACYLRCVCVILCLWVLCLICHLTTGKQVCIGRVATLSFFKFMFTVCCMCFWVSEIEKELEERHPQMSFYQPYTETLWRQTTSSQLWH